jgi:hypothetical protein
MLLIISVHAEGLEAFLIFFRRPADFGEREIGDGKQNQANLRGR